MGHTEYFTVNRAFSNDEWKQIMEKSRILLDNPIISNGLGEFGTSPTIEEDYIGFNGYDENGYETCSLEKEPESSFNCVKTAHKAYSSIVISFLKMVRQIAPNAIELRSDGGSEVFDEPEPRNNQGIGGAYAQFDK